MCGFYRRGPSIQIAYRVRGRRYPEARAGTASGTAVVSKSFPFTQCYQLEFPVNIEMLDLKILKVILLVLYMFLCMNWFGLFIGWPYLYTAFLLVATARRAAGHLQAFSSCRVGARLGQTSARREQSPDYRNKQCSCRARFELGTRGRIRN